MLNVQESSSVGSWFNWISLIVKKTSALFGYPFLSGVSEMFGILSYSSCTFSIPPGLLYFISTLAKENNCMSGQASTSMPICPVGTEGFVLIDFGLRTTLLSLPPTGDAVQAVNGAFPFVKSDKIGNAGTATPSVSEKPTPKTDEAVLLLQKTPKSKLLPTAPGPASRTI